MPSKPSWVQDVMANYTSTDPPKGIFTMSPRTIADASDVEGVAPKGLTSWQRMVLFHRNRGGRGLTLERRQALQEAITLLSKRRADRQTGVNGWEEGTLLPYDKIDPDTFAKRLAKEVRKRKSQPNPLGDPPVDSPPQGISKLSTDFSLPVYLGEIAARWNRSI
jgi:hypothetical protein